MGRRTALICRILYEAIGFYHCTYSDVDLVWWRTLSVSFDWHNPAHQSIGSSNIEMLRSRKNEQNPKDRFFFISRTVSFWGSVSRSGKHPYYMVLYVLSFQEPDYSPQGQKLAIHQVCVWPSAEILTPSLTSFCAKWTR